MLEEGRREYIKTRLKKKKIEEQIAEKCAKDEYERRKHGCKTANKKFRKLLKSQK